MEVARLMTTVTSGSTEAARKIAGKAGKTPVVKTKKTAPPKIDKTQVRVALDNIIRNTRFQYVLKDELDYFVVRIIDKDTDTVIREIPSKELQKVHEGINQALGLLFDELR